MLVPYKYLCGFLIYEVIMGRLIDLTGQKFGRLTVVEKIGIAKHGDHAKWVCKCDCGNIVAVASNCLKSGNTTSCGCIKLEKLLKRNYKHGHSQRGRTDRLYNIWGAMKDRCINKNNDRYQDYGGRGITVCAEWLHDFQAFYDWAISHGYKEGLTLDRIDVNGNYEPSNCRWATYQQQNNNRRSNHLITYNGITKPIKYFADKTGMNKNTIRQRLLRGWSVEQALTILPTKGNRVSKNEINC